MSLKWNVEWMVLGEATSGLAVYADATPEGDARALWLHGCASATLRSTFAQMLRDGLTDCTRLLLVCDGLSYISTACLRETVLAQVQIADPVNKEIVIVNASPEVLAQCKAAAVEQQMAFEKITLPGPPHGAPPLSEPPHVKPPVIEPPYVQPEPIDLSPDEDEPEGISMLLISNDDAWFALSHKTRASVGRGADRDMVIPDERKAVSRQHMTIFKTEDGYCLRDEGSVNGTMIDGEPVEPDADTPLQDAQLITLGHRHHYLLLLEPLLLASPEEYAAFWQAQHLLARLYSQQHRAAIYLTDAPMVLGRDHPVGQLIQSKGIGREHGEIIFDNARYCIIDHSSRNGTYINSQEITPETPVPLSPDDIVRLGGEQYGETFVWQQRKLNGTTWQEECV